MHRREQVGYENSGTNLSMLDTGAARGDAIICRLAVHEADVQQRIALRLHWLATEKKCWLKLA
eukprot:1159597-Pelagomonas_calceolata.AAC.5